MQLFYINNRFRGDILSYDATHRCRFNTILDSLDIDRDLVNRWGVVLKNEPNWTNLLGWLKTLHASKRCVRLDSPAQLAEAKVKRGPDPGHGTNACLVGMFVEAKELRGEVSWEVLERILKLKRPLLIMEDDRWGRD